MISNTELGKRLKYYRKNKGVTQEEMAKHCHVTKNHISALERGIYTCSAPTLIGYTEKLDISLDELVGITIKEPAILPELQQSLANMPMEQQQELSYRILEKPEYRLEMLPELQDMLYSMSTAQQQQILDIIRILKRPLEN